MRISRSPIIATPNSRIPTAISACSIPRGSCGAAAMANEQPSLVVGDGGQEGRAEGCDAFFDLVSAPGRD